MTAVIGFINKHGIFIATDSQVTIQAAGMKQCDSKKLAVIKFPEATTLVARAGSIETADLFQEIFEEMATKTPVVHWRTIANTAEAALKETRAKILGAFAHSSVSSEQCLEYYAGRRCELLLAYVYEGKSYLFTGDSDSAILIKSTHDFVALGSGTNIASFVLDDFAFQNLTQLECFGLAAYTIEMCKRADLYCAGAVQIGTIYSFNDPSKPGECWILERDMAEAFQSAASKTHEAMRGNLGKELNAHFQNVIKQSGCWPTRRMASVPTKSTGQSASRKRPHGSCSSGSGCRRRGGIDVGLTSARRLVASEFAACRLSVNKIEISDEGIFSGKENPRKR